MEVEENGTKMDKVKKLSNCYEYAMEENKSANEVMSKNCIVKDMTQTAANTVVAMTKKKELVNSTAERNGLSSDEDIETFLKKNYKELESKEYLVDGAVLTCTNCTKEDVTVLLDGKEYVYYANKDADKPAIRGLDGKKVYGRLNVTENSNANVNGSQYATVADTVYGPMQGSGNINIPFFGNCLRQPDNEMEKAVFRAIHQEADNGLEKRKEGSCKYLMKLNDKWDNYMLEENYLSFTDDKRGVLSGITMTSILFCRHGGFIYPVFSGQRGKSALGVANEVLKKYTFETVQHAMNLATEALRLYLDVTNNNKTIAGSFIDHAKKKIKFGIKAFLPQKVSNDVVFAGFDVMAKLVPISEKTISENAINNMAVLSGVEKIYTDNTYIENQQQWEKVKFGSWSDMRFAGCEIMATHNALLALGKNMTAQSMVDLISMYEREGAALGGVFGTSPYAIEKYFEENGYEVLSTRSRGEDVINIIGINSDTVIVTAYNSETDIMRQVHTVSITKNGNGKYAVHNAYVTDNSGKYVVKDNNGNGYDTLQEAINNISYNNPACINVIGISNP